MAEARKIYSEHYRRDPCMSAVLQDYSQRADSRPTAVFEVQALNLDGAACLSTGLHPFAEASEIDWSFKSCRPLALQEANVTETGRISESGCVCSEVAPNRMLRRRILHDEFESAAVVSTATATYSQ